MSIGAESQPIVSFEAIVHRARPCDNHDRHDASCRDCLLTLTPCDAHARPNSGYDHFEHFVHDCEACNLKGKVQEVLGIVAHSHPHLIPAGAIVHPELGHAQFFPVDEDGGEG